MDAQAHSLPAARRRIGLLVNPLAGIGGAVGLKGSDGAGTVQRALQLGAVPHAGERAEQALQALLPLRQQMELWTCPAEMGADAARRAGFEPQVLGSIHPGRTCAADTQRLALQMAQAGVELLLFAGGDGTARDMCQALGNSLPVLGIPAGVKIHSAVFAVHPHHAGELVQAFLQGAARLVEGEVLDLDEEAYRQDVICTRLYGTLTVPHRPRWMQNCKTSSPSSEEVQMQSIAEDVVENLPPDACLILGPGTTTRALARRLGVEKTLVGVDAVCGGKLLAADASEAALLELLKRETAQILVSPTGGQGFLFGRGNQPISPQVLRRVGRGSVTVLCTPGKLAALGGQPLLLDTGDAWVDESLSGYYRVVTGYHQRAVYRAAAAQE